MSVWPHVTNPILIPFADLSDDALAGVVESFVLREGTEYGEHDFLLSEKVMQVRAQLQRGEAFVVFDPDSDSVSIVTERPSGGCE
jgi:uncharacterized protein